MITEGLSVSLPMAVAIVGAAAAVAAVVAVAGTAQSQTSSSGRARAAHAKERPVFNIKTILKRPGRDRDSRYSWTGKDAVFVAALQASLIGVLTAAQTSTLHQAAGLVPASAGDKSVEFTIDVDVGGSSYFSLSANYSGMSEDEVRGLMAALSDAVRPFRDQADRVKA